MQAQIVRLLLKWYRPLTSSVAGFGVALFLSLSSKLNGWGITSSLSAYFTSNFLSKFGIGLTKWPRVSGSFLLSSFPKMEEELQWRRRFIKVGDSPSTGGGILLAGTPYKQLSSWE